MDPRREAQRDGISGKEYIFIISVFLFSIFFSFTCFCYVNFFKELLDACVYIL